MAAPGGGAASWLREDVDGLMATYDRSTGGARDACHRDLVRDLLLECATTASRRTLAGAEAGRRVLEDTGALLQGQLRMEAQLGQMQAVLLESGLLRSRSWEEQTEQRGSCLTPGDGAQASREQPNEAAVEQASFPLGGVQPGGMGEPSRDTSLLMVGRSTDTADEQNWRESIELRPEFQSSDRQLDQLCHSAVSQLQNPAPTDSSSIVGSFSFARIGPDRAGKKSEALFLLAPTCTQRLLLDVFSIVVLCYDVWSLPYQIAWDVPQAGTTMLLACASCGYWAVDMVSHFRTGFYNHDGNLVMESRRIAWHYITTSFCLDMTILLADIVALLLQTLNPDAAGSPNGARLGRVLKISRVARLVGTLRMWSLAHAFDRLYARSATLHATTVFMFDTITFASIILWLNHVMACTWFALGAREDTDTEITWLHTDVGNGRTYADESPRYQYFTSLHWAVTQMTPGSMQVFAVNSEERQFNILCLVAGLVVFSFLVSSISAAVTQFKIRLHEHNEQLEAMRRFLRNSRISSEVALTVNKQVVQKLRSRKPMAAKDVDVMNLVSLSTQSALMLELCCPILGAHGFFGLVFEIDKHFAEEFCRSCSDFLSIAATDTLFLAGVEASRMYFVSGGELSYVTSQDRKSPPLSQSMNAEREVTVVKREEWLCEAALWCNWSHVGTAENRGPSFCELLFVRTESLQQVVKRDPLMNSLTWAYGRRFCAFLADSKAPGCPRPNDVITQFGVDEVLLSLPHSAKVFLGQFTISSLLTRRGWLGSLFSYEGQVETLQSEVDHGRSLLIIGKSRAKGGEKVLRVVSLAVLRLQRADGRCLARLRLETRPEGHVEATCKFPGTKSLTGESRDMIVNRLLEQQLEPAKRHIRVDNFERREESKLSDKLHVHTRYIKLLIHATWLEEVEAKPVGGNPSVSVPSYPDPDIATQSLTNHRVTTEPSRISRVGPSRLCDIPVFTILDGHFAWLHEEDIAYYSEPAGQAELHDWLSDIHDLPVQNDLENRRPSGG
ncbi:unnamed protein product [Prorocentrum cordatum]|uniref:Plant heme peroxidase family profile domain-containing protein n=1 Tax=Prorocentrum cordatum TaxID=2364126 RepID=A0ABN9R2E9_9DINO|nr:unnamed protein product [Polarella glacialis]